jgi:hypothetical protein
VGSINKTGYSVTPDDVKISKFCINYHLQCIESNMTMMNTASASTLDNALVISQLTNTISIQNKEAMESNNLCQMEIERQIKKEEKKKDPRKFTLPSWICSNVPQPLINTTRKKKFLQLASDSSMPKCWIGTVWANPSI